MLCGLETGVMEGSGSLTATLCPWAASSYLTELFIEANSNISFYQDNPKVITGQDLAELPGIAGVILQYIYSGRTSHFHCTHNTQGQELCFLTFFTVTVPHK